MELRWYAKHRDELVTLCRAFRTICGELSGAIYATQAVGQSAHYMTTKLVFEEWDVLSKLENLTSKLLEYDEKADSPRLQALKSKAQEAIEYASTELPGRASYKKAIKADTFRSLIRTIVAMFDEIEDEVEAALFASVIAVAMEPGTILPAAPNEQHRGGETTPKPGLV